MFSSNQKKTSTNTDGNYEIWKIQTDGTGLTALTNTTDLPGATFAVVSGSGNRIAYLSKKDAPAGAPDTYDKFNLSVMDASGGNVHLLASDLSTRVRWPDITLPMALASSSRQGRTSSARIRTGRRRSTGSRRTEAVCPRSRTSTASMP